MRKEPDTGTLLLVAPLVQVAWADGHVSDGERLSIVEAAAGGLVDLGGGAFEELLDLLGRRPSQEFFARGLEAVRSAFEALPFTQAVTLQRKLIAACTRTAAASRSALGPGISEAERRAIDQIRAEIVRHFA